MGVLAAKKAMFRPAILLVCCLAAAGIYTKTARAQQGLRPEPPPGNVGAQLRPDPAPGARTPQTAAVFTPPAPSPAPSHVAATVPVTSTVSFAPRQAAVRETARTTRPVTKPSPPRGRPSWAWWPWRGAVSVLASAGQTSSSGVSIPLVAGLALLLLVIGEAAFLGLAANVFGIPERRRRERPRYAEASFPIRQVFPRR
jgi:hypothetical protein